MIIYTDGYRTSMVSVIPVNPGYHNNRNWALANKAKGKNATIYAVGATIAGCTKILAEKDSITYTLLNFGHKTLEAFRNLEQYLMYKRNDDDVAKDKATKPLAGTIGSIASNYETIINPIALPLSTFLNEKWGESYASISNWLSSFWWRFRLCFEKINLKSLKLLPSSIKYLSSNDKDRRNKALQLIQNSLSPILGVLGSFFIGLFVPIRAWKKLTGNENKWLDACADSGMLTQHIRYLTKFTLEELFNAIDTTVIKSALAA